MFEVFKRKQHLKLNGRKLRFESSAGVRAFWEGYKAV